MLAVKGPLFAPFNKLLLQSSTRRLFLVRRTCATRRPLKFLLKPPHKNFLRPVLTSVLPYKSLRPHCASVHRRCVRLQGGITPSCAFETATAQQRDLASIQTRNFKLVSARSQPSRCYSRPRYSRIRNKKAVIVLGIIAGAVVLQSYFLSTAGGPTGILLNHPNYLESDRDIVYTAGQDWTKMTGEALPGRPGNLTPDQEEKLREIWTAALQVFGVLDSHRAKDTNGGGQITPLAGPSPASETAIPEKPKKRRLALFGRKHKDSDNESLASTDSISPGLSPLSPGLVADSDDKYGQTKQFHDTLAQQTPESLRAAFWSMVKHDHPDALLLRFLRARKWDVEKALVMMVSTMHWRAKDMHVDDDIMESGEEAALLASRSSNPTIKRSGEDFLAQMRMGKSFLHGVDKSGRPMCFVRVRLHKQGEQTEESVERYTVFVIESARMILAPPVDTACIVFDMTGFSLANMDYGPVKFMIKCFEANYPESLGVVLVHKAPWVFQGIWKIIRGWLDPVVASKVHFTNSVDELNEFIPRSQIPKDFGGDENWTYHYVEPAPNENEVMKDTVTKGKLLAERENIVKEYEKATLDWIDHSTALEATDIKARRHRIAAALKEDYWKLDPYVRARSLYDRTGVIQPAGKICFYPAIQSAPPASSVNGVHTVEPSADDVD